MELTVPLDTVCRLIVRARELEAPVPDTDDEDEGENESSDSDEYGVIEEEADTSVEDEVRALLEDLSDDEVIEISALAMIGRGTYDASEWDDAIEESGSDPDDAIDQLLDMPMLAAYLDAGLAAFDLSCDGIDQAD